MALKGRLDIQGVNDIDLKFTLQTTSRRRPTIIDISGLEYVGSIGLRIFLTMAKALKRYGVKMVLLNPQPQVEEVFRIVGFSEIIPLMHDKEQALEILKQE